jgi:metal-responsive CopG/Arc/MetJ family transcriptional regulator
MEPKLDPNGNVHRISVSFPAASFQELELIAKEKKVSVAWVVRDAVEEYLQARMPLLYELRSTADEPRRPVSK